MAQKRGIVNILIGSRLNVYTLSFKKDKIENVQVYIPESRRKPDTVL
jgi:hypothetical protein